MEAQAYCQIKENSNTLEHFDTMYGLRALLFLYTAKIRKELLALAVYGPHRRQMCFKKKKKKKKCTRAWSWAKKNYIFLNNYPFFRSAF